MNRVTVTFGLLFVASTQWVACNPVGQGLRRTASLRIDLADSATRFGAGEWS